MYLNPMLYNVSDCQIYCQGRTSKLRICNLNACICMKLLLLESMVQIYLYLRTSLASGGLSVVPPLCVAPRQ